MLDYPSRDVDRALIGQRDPTEAMQEDDSDDCLTELFGTGSVWRARPLGTVPRGEFPPKNLGLPSGRKCAKVLWLSFPSGKPANCSGNWQTQNIFQGTQAVVKAQFESA